MVNKWSNYEKYVRDLLVYKGGLNKGIKRWSDLDMLFKYTFDNCCTCLDKECKIDEFDKMVVDNLKQNYFNVCESTCTKRESITSVSSDDRLSIMTRVEKNINDGKCNYIRTSDISDDTMIDNGKDIPKLFKNMSEKLEVALNIIGMFKEMGLLNVKKNRYYLLNGNNRLSWTNIKSLNGYDAKLFLDNDKNKKVYNEIVYLFSGKKVIENDNEMFIMYIRCLFWYFRKAIVDSILSDLLNYINMDLDEDEYVSGISVGSTKLTSDYDITLDGSFNKTAQVIKYYIYTVNKIFGDYSDRVFDTNIYGVSFIKSERDPISSKVEKDKKLVDMSNKIINDVFSEKFKCGNGKYIKSSDNELVASQHVWAFVKFLLKMENIQKNDEKLYNLFMLDLSKNLKNNIYMKKAGEFINQHGVSVRKIFKCSGNNR